MTAAASLITTGPYALAFWGGVVGMAEIEALLAEI